jgi:hypothetical protein
MRQDLPDNRFKRSLVGGPRHIGLWLTMESVYATEIASTAGYDWLFLDMKHTAVSLSDIGQHILAARGRNGRTRYTAPKRRRGSNEKPARFWSAISHLSLSATRSGTKGTASSPAPRIASRCQTCSNPRLTPHRRGNSDIFALGRRLSATIAAFSSAVHRRRWTEPVIGSLRR